MKAEKIKCELPFVFLLLGARGHLVSCCQRLSDGGAEALAAATTPFCSAGTREAVSSTCNSSRILRRGRLTEHGSHQALQQKLEQPSASVCALCGVGALSRPQVGACRACSVCASVGCPFSACLPSRSGSQVGVGGRPQVGTCRACSACVSVGRPYMLPTQSLPC